MNRYYRRFQFIIRMCFPTATRTGFTLIELMIIIAIIGILSALAIPKFAQAIKRSNEGRTKGFLGALHLSISIYYADNEACLSST